MIEKDEAWVISVALPTMLTKSQRDNAFRLVARAIYDWAEGQNEAEAWDVAITARGETWEIDTETGAVRNTTDTTSTAVHDEEGCR